MATPLVRAVEHRIRFSQAQAKQLDDLSAEVYRSVGHEFDIESPEELAKTLKKLRIKSDKLAPEHLAMVPRLHWTEPCHEPLEPHRHEHEVIPLLLEYRRIETSQPRLASRELYDRIRKSATGLPAQSIRFQLQRGPTPA